MSLTRCLIRIVTPLEGRISTRCLFLGVAVDTGSSSAFRLPLAAAALYRDAMVRWLRRSWRAPDLLFARLPALEQKKSQKSRVCARDFAPLLHLGLFFSTLADDRQDARGEYSKDRGTSCGPHCLSPRQAMDALAQVRFNGSVD